MATKAARVLSSVDQCHLYLLSQNLGPVLKSVIVLACVEVSHSLDLGWLQRWGLLNGKKGLVAEALHIYVGLRLTPDN